MKMSGAGLFYVAHIIAVVHIQILTVSALTCLNCDAIANPRLCTHVTKCFAGEKCGMETFISKDGDFLYKLGCIDSNICGLATTQTPGSNTIFTSCHQCCDDHDLCNVRGCNATGFPLNRGPVCYSCESFPEGFPCHRITHCEPHEVCYNDARLEFQTDMLYSSGCRSKHQCADQSIDPVVGIGRRSTSICTDCCQGDLCNLQCRNMNVCSDDSSCQLLMTNFDVCKSPDLAKQFCQRTCGLCSSTGTATTCTDTRLDCAYIHSIVNMCGTKQNAAMYGCLYYCGYCSGSNTGVPGTVNWGTTWTTGFRTSREQTTYPARFTTSATMTTSAALGSFTPPPLHVGDKVIRGPDWNNTNNVTNLVNNSTGEVLAVLAGWVIVSWPQAGGSYTYRYGKDGKYEVQLYARGTSSTSTATSWTTATTVSGYFTTSVGYSTSTNAYPPLVAGQRIVRGPDWIWQDQDGHGYGTVTGPSAGGWVSVIWDNTKTENAYRYGMNGKYDIALAHVTSTAPPGGVISTTVTIPTSSLPALLHDGDRVVRGQDWIWGDQDHNGLGTVMGNPSVGWVLVTWDADGFSNSYRYGLQGNYDVQKVSSATVTRSRTSVPTTSANSPKALAVGDTVVRGPDWRWKDQDGNGTGTVVGAGNQGWVTVRWNNTGAENTYRYGAEGAYDVQLVSVSGGITTIPLSVSTSAPPSSGPGLVKSMYVGARVTKGLDWKYGTQDNSGPGTVRALPPQVPDGWVQVQWDNGYVNNYRMGAENSYDVMLVPGTYNPPSTG